MLETRVESLDQEDPLDKEMSTHYRILAWKIPWGRKESDTTERMKQDPMWANSDRPSQVHGFPKELAEASCSNFKV